MARNARINRQRQKPSLEDEIAHLRDLDLKGLRVRWQGIFKRQAPSHLPRHLLFGVLAYLVMNVIVVPLSNAANPDFSLGMVVKELVAHTILFCVPIAGIVRAFARNG